MTGAAREYWREWPVLVDPACPSLAIINDCGDYVEMGYQGRVFVIRKGYLVERYDGTVPAVLQLRLPEVVGEKAETE